MNTEREARLLASTTFTVPRLDGIRPGIVADPPEQRHFDAVYYDTDDLRLARAGVTLRWRDGEDEPRWTLTLPRSHADRAFDRRELDAAGAEDEPPVELCDLVRAHVRTAALTPVARLHTERTATGLRDRTGARVAEVVDDLVTGCQDERSLGPFREVVVEVCGDPPPDANLLRAAVRTLGGAGCEPAHAVPKLLRFLGAAASAEPEPAMPQLGTEPDAGTLVRYTLAKSVRRMLEHDAGLRLGRDPEDLHQFRVATRRLRSDLRAFGAVLDRDRTRSLRADLRWLGEVVGAVRDNDVLAERLRVQAQQLPTRDAEATALLLEQLAEEGDRARSAMLDSLRGERYDMLVEALLDAVRQPMFAPDAATTGKGSAARLVTTTVRRQWRGLRDAVTALPDPPGDADLHRIRILAKRLRYAAEIGLPLFGHRAAKLATAATDIQTVLGDQHDAVVAEQWLRTTAAVLPAVGIVAGQLVARQRADAAASRQRWPELWHRAAEPKLRDWL